MAPSVSTSRMACETGLEVALHIQGGENRPVLPGLFQQNVVIVRVVRVREHDVGMAINQSRQDSSVGQIRLWRRLGESAPRRWRDRLDTIAANHDQLIVEHFP